MTPSEEMVSTISSAGCFAASMALRTSSIQRAAAGRGLVVDDAHGLDGVRLVLLETLLDQVGVGADAPVGRQELRSRGRASPPSAFHSTANWPVSTISTRSPGESVLTRAASQAPVPDDGKMMTGLCGLEDRLDAREDALGELLELRAAVVQDLLAHRIQDALGNRSRSRNLQEMAARPARLVRHRSFPYLLSRRVAIA